MTDAWNMTGGQVYVAPVGADPKDPSRWHRVGTLTEMEMRQDDGWFGGGHTNTLTTRGPVTIFKPEPVKKVEFTFNMKPYSLDTLALYYGADAIKFNNRGETRKEEKHMDVLREFKDEKGDKTLAVEPDLARRTQGSGGVHLDIGGGGEPAFGWFEKADVPLIAHALFEKSGWPDAKKDSAGDWGVLPQRGRTAWGFEARDQEGADRALAEAIANLAAYNAWHEGSAEREAAEVAKKAEAEAAAAKKREHDELRTSAIALEALAIYNEAMPFSPDYKSWDGVNSGNGTDDDTVREHIAKAEAARAAKPAPKLGDRVRVSQAGIDESGANFASGAVGIVVADVDHDGDILVKAPAGDHIGDTEQYVKPEYVTILATAEEAAAEKAKAERDAGIAAIIGAATQYVVNHHTAEILYDRGIRATA